MSRYEFRLPDIGEGLAEAEVARWLVKVGDHVTEDQPVVEMMTDKAAVEIPAPGAGVVVEQRAAEGEVVKIGTVLYVLETDGLSAATSPAAPLQDRTALPAGPPPQSGEATGVLAPPAVRKLARELAVDLAKVKGSGPGGRISAEDVQRHASRPATAEAFPPAASPAAAQAGEGRRVALRGVRRRMAETMAASARTSATVSAFHEVDAGEFQATYRRLRAEAESRGRRFPFDTLLVRACALALQKHPIFNSSLDEERMEVVMHEHVNIGVATATPDGLIVPVVANAGALGIEELAAEVDRVTTAAREGRTSVADLRGGTFTVSNTGGWRGPIATSLVRVPEVALVAFGYIEEKAVVRGGQVVARPVVPMSINFDHRVIDGEQGLTFALTLRDLVEQPQQLL